MVSDFGNIWGSLPDQFTLSASHEWLKWDLSAVAWKTNAHYMYMNLNSWCPVCGAVWEDYRIFQVWSPATGSLLWICTLRVCRCTLLYVVEIWPLNFLLLMPWFPTPNLLPPLWTYNPQELKVHELFFNFIMEFYQSNRKVTNTVMSLPEPSETEFTHIQEVQKQSPYEYLWLVTRQQRMEEA